MSQAAGLTDCGYRMTVEPGDYKRRTMEAYDKLSIQLSEGYDVYFASIAQMEADRFMAGLRPGSTILDLGCGAGVASGYFARHGFRPVPADLSTGMLSECARKGLQDIVRLDLEYLPFVRRSFDAVWAHTSLIHVPKHRIMGVLTMISKVLKPGGRLFVALREGTGEGYEGETSTQRWFANFGPNEFESYVPSGLHPISSGRTKFGERAFLNYHLACTQP